MKVTTSMTREEYIKFTITCLNRNAVLFYREITPDMKEFFAERISQNQLELTRFGFTWEEVERLEVEAYQTA